MTLKKEDLEFPPSREDPSRSQGAQDKQDDREWL